MAGTRIENDTLGAVEIPVAALFGAQTARAVKNFPISGRSAHPQLIKAYLRLKKAAAIANHQCGVLPQTQRDLIVQAAEFVLSLPETDWPALFPVDPYQAGAGTSQNMNINEVVANQANLFAGSPLGSYRPVHPNDHVNCSQSTNDSFPTVMRLALMDSATELARNLRELGVAFTIHAEAWQEIPKSARTHLQDAVPMTLGQEFSGYAVTLSRCAAWIEAGKRELGMLGIGGSAAGTGLNVPAGFAQVVIDELGRMTSQKLRAADNLFEAMQSQAPVGLFAAMLKLTALELTRICNDLRLLASGPMTGLSEIILPAVQPGSSIMPGKVNPSILEMANQTWFSVLGYEQTVCYCLQAGQLELNVMMPMMVYAMLEATTVTSRALIVLRTQCVEGLTANVPRLEKYFHGTPQVATALNPKLGYARVAELVKESLATGKPVLEIVREKNLISEEELKQLVDVRKLTGRN